MLSPAGSVYCIADEHDFDEEEEDDLLHQHRNHHHGGGPAAVLPPADILAQLVLDVAGTAPPHLSRRFTEQCHPLGAMLAAALARHLVLSSSSSSAASSSSSMLLQHPPPALSHRRVCLAALLGSPQQAVEAVLRDSLLHHLAPTFHSASPDDVGCVARIARRLAERLLVECSRGIPGAAGEPLAATSTSAAAAVAAVTPSRIRGRDDETAALGLHRSVSLGCPRLDAMLSPKHRGFLRGQVHEIYGEAACGKSTWAAQLLLHTLRTAKAHQRQRQQQQRAMAIAMRNNSSNNTSENGSSVAGGGGIGGTQRPHTNNNDDSMQADEDDDDVDSSPHSSDLVTTQVVLLSAEPVSMPRIEQVARAEWMHMNSTNNGNGNGNIFAAESAAASWRTLLEGFLIVELRHVDHFEEMVRTLIRQHAEQQQRLLFASSAGVAVVDTPLIVLDSVAALVEKSMGSSAAPFRNSGGSGNSSAVPSSFYDERPTDPAEKAEYIERTGAALRQLSWALRSAVVVVNQARWAGPEAERAAASLGSTGASKNGGSAAMAAAAQNSRFPLETDINSSSGASAALFGGNVQPALGYQWSTFVTGCSVELSRGAAAARLVSHGSGMLTTTTVAARRRARLVRSSTCAAAGPVEYDLVAGGISDSVPDSGF